MNWPALLDLGAAIAAFAAALFWFLSAAKKLPPMYTYIGQAPDDAPFLVALRHSIRMNRLGAAFAGLSALLTGIKLLFFI